MPQSSGVQAVFSRVNPPAKYSGRNSQALLRQPRGAAGGEDQTRWTPGMGFQKQMQAAQRTSFPGLDLHRRSASINRFIGS